MNFKNKRYYFDYAASAYGNPSSLHSEGKAAKQALENARNRCAEVLKVPPETLFFTSGGTESNSIAIFSNLIKPGKSRVLYSAAEHASVREAMETLSKMGKPAGVIPVDATGKVTPELLEKTLTQYSDTRFVSIMAVNNETGTVTDIPALRDVIKNHCEKTGAAPVHFHCDLVQAAGKIPVNIIDWQIDSASISAHKMGGMRGIGLLYLKRGSKTDVFYKSAGQESGIRGGTENVDGAASLAYCLENFAAPEALLANYKQAAARWDKLITALSGMDRCTLIPGRGTWPEGQENCLKNNEINQQDNQSNKNILSPAFSPYILQAAFKDIPGEVMARALDDMGFAVSTGSACSSSSPERPVLVAMGLEEKLQIEGIRISQGYNTTDEEIDFLLNAIKEVLKFL